MTVQLSVRVSNASPRRSLSWLKRMLLPAKIPETSR
jgi:hypothetical protein